MALFGAISFVETWALKEYFLTICMYDSTFKVKNQILVPNIFIVLVQSYRKTVFILKIKFFSYNS